MDLRSYTNALVEYAEQLDDIGPLTTLRDALFARMNAGEGKTLVNASPGGKTFEFQVTMTVEEQFTAVVDAIKTYNGAAGSSPVTFIDFSGASSCR